MGDIAFKIGNEYLDLSPNTILDLEEENPFLQLGAEIKGQYSLPFSIPCTEKNMRLLGFPNLIQARKSTAGIDAVLMIGGLQHSRGQVKIETTNNHIIHPQRGTISLYYLFGISDFYKLVENKYLTDLEYGSDYSFPRGNNLSNPNREDPTIFFGYITDVMRNGTPDTHEFAIFPVINEGDPGSNYENVLFQANVPNSFAIHTDSLLPVINYTSYSYAEWKNNICPFPYLHWVIKKLFQNFQWKVQSELFDDPDFKKITLLHSGKIEQYRKNPVTWNMKNHVPRVKIPTFLIGLANRFGLWFDFDYKKKLCTITYKKTILKSRDKLDITSKVGATYSGKISGTNKRYGLMQQGGQPKPEFGNFTYRGELNNYDDLPNPSDAILDNLYFIRGENAYYFCTEADNVVWQKSTDNNWDIVPAEKTDDIQINCLVPGMSDMLQMRNNLGDFINRWFVMPVINYPAENAESETFYICYHYGIRPGVNRTNSMDHPFPMGSAGCHDLEGNLITSKALVFDYPGDRGVYVNNWEYFLNLFKQREEVTIPVSFDLLDLVNFDYKKSLLIRNTEYFIKNPHFSLPLREFTQVELVRL